jgi:RHS repeat-associated protein
MTRKGDDIGNPFAFTGRVYDSESGLYYYRARYYDPELGIFVSPDPYPKALENPQVFNEYAYVENDPANLVDPLGLSSLTQHYLRQQIAPPFFLYPVRAPGESLTSPQFWNRMANDYQWLRENFGPGTAANYRRRLQQKLIRSLERPKPGIVSRLLDKGARLIKRAKDKAILEAERLKLWAKQIREPLSNTSASRTPAVPGPGAGGASTATGHGPVEGIGHGPSPGGATATAPQGPSYFSRFWNFAGPTVKRVPLETRSASAGPMMPKRRAVMPTVGKF